MLVSGFGGLNMTGFSVLGLGQPAFSSLAVTPVAVTVPAVIQQEQLQRGGRVVSAFDSCSEGHWFESRWGRSLYVTTVGKLFTPTVPSRAEGRLNQLAPGTAVPL